ncbi:glycosyltransferase [Paenibacillus assamensis]|uniref:glycosyltransferase n=1 Tax=Paenibacillus assamensis TaxID=311244 RepID=UPI000406A9DD|nr:glycosyltransferase [Paenibacillus assamensis]
MVDSCPLVSIVIPCYNYGHFVVEAVDSCLASTYTNIEIIIVDDGSTDQNTIEVLNQLTKPKTKIIHQKNQGLPAARNTGFKFASGKYVLPLDADDTIEKTLIEKATWVLENNPNVGFVSFWLKHFGNEDWVWMPPAFDMNRLLNENTVTVTSLVRKEAWESVGGYSEDMKMGYEDWEFWISLASKGWLGHQIPEPLFNYRKHGRSMIDSSKEKHDLIIQQIRSKHPELYNQQQRVVTNNNYDAQFYKVLKKITPRFIKESTKKIILRYKRNKTDKQYSIKETTSKSNTVEKKKTSKDKKNILFIFPWLEVGGADKVNLDLLKQLDQTNYNITIITTLESHNPWYDKFYEVTNNIYHLPNYMNFESYFVFINQIIQNNNIDLIHISNSREGYELLPKIKQSHDIPVVALVHNYVPEDPWDYARISAEYERYIDKIIVITNSLKKIMTTTLHVDAKKVSTIENGVDEQMFKPRPKDVSVLESLGINDGDVVISYIGRLREEKDPFKFVRIMKKFNEINSRNSEVIFLIIGDGELFGKTRKMIEAQSISNVKLLGARDDIPHLLSITDIVASTSIREGLPIIGLEAMASGICVVATNVTGWNDLIEDKCDGFLINGEKEFAEQLEVLVNNEDFRNSIGKSAREKIENEYSLKVFSMKYELIYKELLEEKQNLYPIGT